MNSKKLYYGFAVLLFLLGIGLLAGTYEAVAILKKRSDKLVAQKVQSAALDQLQVQFAKDKKDIAAYNELNKIAESIVPQDKDQAEAVREIVNIARNSGIHSLSSVTFPASTLGGTTASTNKLTQLTPVKGISGVYTLQITVQQSSDGKVSYATFINFLRGLEQNRRTAQVSSINVQPDSKNPSQVAFSLVVEEYIKP